MFVCVFFSPTNLLQYHYNGGKNWHDGSLSFIPTEQCTAGWQATNVWHVMSRENLLATLAGLPTHRLQSGGQHCDWLIHGEYLELINVARCLLRPGLGVLERNIRFVSKMTPAWSPKPHQASDFEPSYITICKASDWQRTHFSAWQSQGCQDAS